MDTHKQTSVIQMFSNSDNLLLEELKGGNLKAFDTIFHKYYKFLVASAYLVIKDEQEAKDIVQDLLFEFWDKKIYLRLEGDIKNYLYKAIQNRCLNYLRQKKHQQSFSNQFDEYALQQEDTSPQECQLQNLDVALGALPYQRREALRQVFLEDKKYQEAADSMGVSINTLKTHLKIGIKNLRSKLMGRTSEI